MKKLQLSIIYPIHNEENVLDTLLKKTLTLSKKLQITIEIICVLNDSTDNSEKIINNYSNKHPHIIKTFSDKGWGNAVIQGIKISRANVICYMVSDLQVDPKHITTLYTHWHKDTHKNTTLYKISRINRENITRKTISFLYNIASYLILGLQDTDANATPKLFSKSLLTDITLCSSNIGLDPELLYKLKKKNIQVKNYPVFSNKRSAGTSTTNMYSILEMYKTLIQLRMDKL